MKRSQGFSLIELMISLTLGLLVVGMVLAAYLSGTTTQRSLNQTSILTENGRFAIQQLNDELQMAGFYGNYDYQPRNTTTLPSSCTISKSNLVYAARAPVQGYNNIGLTGGTAASDLAACMTLAGKGDSIMEGTDVLVVRRTNSNKADYATLNDDTFYLQTTPTEFRLLKGSEKANFDLEDKDGNRAQIRKLEQTIYYVSGLSSQLKKLTLSDAEYTETIVADNIENFQVQFGIDTDDSGAAGSYVATPTLDQLPEIASVRVFLLVRGQAPDATITDSKIYDFGLDGDMGPFNDHFKRKLFQITSRVNNVSMRRER